MRSSTAPPAITVRSEQVPSDVRPWTQDLLGRITNPLCGLDKGVGYILRSEVEPRFFVAGAELTGVHLLLGQREPGSYHIGGGGVLREEALIRTLAESIERYGQLIGGLMARGEIREATYEQLVGAGERVLDAEKLRLFTDRQLTAPGFPYEPFRPDASFGWLGMRSLTDSGPPVVVPAQLVLVGYAVQRDRGEPWLASAVTTGTAAHTSRPLALRNALLELVQIDAAMGHWYSDADAGEVRFDHTARPLERLIERSFPRNGARPAFYRLPSPDLPGIVIACAIRQHGRAPTLSVGLGADFGAQRAMYKALTESIGVMHLGKIGLVNAGLERNENGNGADQIDPRRILDLDSNVTYYTQPGRSRLIEAKLGGGAACDLAALEDEAVPDAADQIDAIVEAFGRTGKQLLVRDLTTTDIAQLGFHVVRAWSPDTLAMCLPSAPPEAHPRFRAYGGVADWNPHPYP